MTYLINKSRILFSRKTLSQQGKLLNDRITRRKSFSSKQWINPTIHGAYTWGWSNFLPHKYLFYDQSNIDGWQYIYEDSIKFSLRFFIYSCDKLKALS